MAMGKLWVSKPQAIGSGCAPDHRTVGPSDHEPLGLFSTVLTMLTAKDKMAGAKANFVSFYIRRIGRILPIYYAIPFVVLLANSQAWSTDFKVSMYTFKQFQEPE